MALPNFSLHLPRCCSCALLVNRLTRCKSGIYFRRAILPDAVLISTGSKWYSQRKFFLDRRLSFPEVENATGKYWAWASGLRERGRAGGPFRHWAQLSAIQAARARKSRRTIRTHRVALKRIEGLLAQAANPESSHGRRGLARRARKTLVARKLRDSRERLRVPEPGPAIQQNERRDRADPNRAR